VTVGDVLELVRNPYFGDTEFPRGSALMIYSGEPKSKRAHGLLENEQSPLFNLIKVVLVDLLLCRAALQRHTNNECMEEVLKNTTNTIERIAYQNRFKNLS
jgi:hypothetical protein